jgi:energy-coupling factor transport system permease protein
VAVGVAAVLLLALTPPRAALLALVLTGGAVAARGPALRSFLLLIAGIGGLTLAVNAFTAPGAVLWRLGPFALTSAGLAAGAARGLRLVGLAALARLLAIGVAAGDLAALAPGLTRPFERRWPALGGAGLALGLAARFTPEIVAEAARIRVAAAARPPRPAARGLAGRRVAVESFYLPLLAGALRRAEEVARTLDARGYASGPTTRRSEDRLGPAGVALVLAIVAALGLVLVLDRRFRAGG